MQARQLNPPSSRKRTHRALRAGRAASHNVPFACTIHKTLTATGPKLPYFRRRPNRGSDLSVPTRGFGAGRTIAVYRPRPRATV